MATSVLVYINRCPSFRSKEKVGKVDAEMGSQYIVYVTNAQTSSL